MRLPRLNARKRKWLTSVAGTLTVLALAWAGDFFDFAPDSNEQTKNTSTIIRECRVTSVHDGDSLRARCPGFNKTLAVRLDQIDAPELDQPHGMASRDLLRKLCPVGKPIKIHDLGKDTYNRHLGRVYCQSQDISAVMVAQGAAWVYDYYAKDPELYRLQNQAKREATGLWAAPNPVAPWSFRYQQRHQKNSFYKNN